MSAVDFFSQDKVWFEKPRYDEAERRFYEHQGRPSEETQVPFCSGFYSRFLSTVLSMVLSAVLCHPIQRPTVLLSV